jgi:hypothetical protein
MSHHLQLQNTNFKRTQMTDFFVTLCGAAYLRIPSSHAHGNFLLSGRKSEPPLSEDEL